ncbi:hypothetical protein [Larkinella terrae]|uniref:Uncharacterized protein n=1 Tax=Larkinella terrae TaxID=2025311 RepID=A0A7K0EPP0_9BACT|nr:hypothetical protein [Larkinella terrae]MRS63795.1 hypothetical protein [Larkinella terrae]
MAKAEDRAVAKKQNPANLAGTVFTFSIIKKMVKAYRKACQFSFDGVTFRQY